ncbi:MAG TPA: DNA gyrase subunit A [Candidatus Methylacidiphilales bacterium]|jgi:DNA gyrase subunit A|nr:DNA gyrase subunit A [Candidatus Methylacidiphilales bacterium]
MPENLFSPGERIERVNVAEEIGRSFLDYSMSVIISRALPDVRDGLKPSQRRILYAMHELGLLPGRATSKCAGIVGETMKKFHPHGDQAIYPTLVHMAEPWSMRERLIEGKGNFGSVEGDAPAAMRYTEARLTHLGAILMEDIDKDTVDFQATYDEKNMEPVVLPAAFPNLLVNGGTGIAVGMATNLAPHNLTEVIDAICAQIDKPTITITELAKIIKGPDFPTGCTLIGLEGIKSYFETGRGGVKVRAKLHTEMPKGGKEQIIVTEIPFNVNRSELVARIAQLVNEKELSEITDVRDESDESTRVVIELKRDAIAKVVINKLYKMTALETSFAVNQLAIDGGRPKTLNLKELINCYIEHRREVVMRRTRFELREAQRKSEVLEGYLIALANLDEVIKIIRKAADREEARVKLAAYNFTRVEVERFGIRIHDEKRLTNGRYVISAEQVTAILELRLYQLTGLERDKIVGDYQDLLKRISDLIDILAKEIRVLTIIKKELAAIRDKHGNERRTQIVPEEGEMAIEDLIANEGVIITITHNSLIKRTNISSYRAQRRGGRGVIGMTTREGDRPEDDDFVEHLFTASTHDYLMFFTNSGRVYVERVHEIPDMGRASKGRSIANLLEMKPGEKVAALIRVESKKDAQGNDNTWTSGGYVLFATQKGTVKKTSLEDFANCRKGGIIAIGIESGDNLIEVKLTSGSSEAVLITREGMSIRFEESDVRSMGRPATGVRGISLDKDDVVVALAVVDPNATLLVAGEHGIGKRTAFDEYRVQSRGGKGIITMKTNEKTGRVVGALTVIDKDEIMLLTQQGQMVRTPVKDIREAGRNTQGVKLINLNTGDKLTAIARVISESDEPEAPAEGLNV